MPTPTKRSKRTFTRFLLAGGIGFIVDSGILTLLMHAGWSALPSRLVSFGTAVTATWLLNRLWTFESSTDGRLPRQEYALYFGVQIIGAFINLTVFLAILRWVPGLDHMPVIPLACGAALGLGFNYLGSKKLVFRRKGHGTV